MIRNVETNDAEKIAQIKIETWRKTYLNIFPDELLKNLELNSEIQKCLDNIKNRNVIVYEKNGEVIAYCYYGKRNDTNYKEYGGEVFALYVKNDCQEHGVGTKLLNFAIKDLFTKYKKVLLWCAKENTRAISFYKKNGLEIIGEEVENIAGKDVEKVALGISLNEKSADSVEVKSKNKSAEKYSELEENKREVENIMNNKNLYKLKKSANYIENDENIAVYTNPDLIFLKDETKMWFKEIINNKNNDSIPQKFINYLLEKEVIEAV